MHRNLRVSYFAQHHIEDFDLNLTPIETIQKRKPGMQAEGNFMISFVIVCNEITWLTLRR